MAKLGLNTLEYSETDKWENSIFFVFKTLKKKFWFFLINYIDKSNNVIFILSRYTSHKVLTQKL